MQTHSISRSFIKYGRDVDVCYVDHTAGPILEAVLQHINLGARIPLVGLISQYNAEDLPPGSNLMPLLAKRALIKGFVVSDYQERQAEFLDDMSHGHRQAS
jgi:NADPH-dependent curcumin reductase